MRISGILILAISLVAAAHVWADSITLKTGETMTGAIKNETATDVTIDVQVSDSITDERVIQKSDIASMQKTQPDEMAYKQLIAVQPNPQISYSAASYDQIISSLDAFQTQYPASTYLPEIQKLEAAFKDEKKRVGAGEIKYLGQWLLPAQAARQRVQIGGLELYDAMQQQAANGGLLAALQTFDTIERGGYAGSRSYPAAAQLALAVIPRFEQELAGRMQEVKADQAQLKATLAATSEPEKSQIATAARAEQDQDIAVIAAAVKNGARWVPLIPRCEVSIQTLQRTATSEYQRLGSIPVAMMNQSLAEVDAAKAAMASRDFKTANSLLSAASALWSQDDAAHYLKEQLVAAAPTPKPTPAHTPPPVAQVAASRPTPTPAADTAPSDDAPKPFYMTVQGAIMIAAVVLVIGGIAAALGQRKARQQATE
ncbi:MAG: PTPDL family protein [Chthoniobacteraceae bacterium]|jgi:hypothetical protein